MLFSIIIMMETMTNEQLSDLWKPKLKTNLKDGTKERPKMLANLY